MPRRMIYTDLFGNEKIAALDFAGRYFFIGTFTYADDDGRVKGSNLFLKGNIFPFDAEITEEVIGKYKKQCHDLGLLVVYEDNGKEFIHFPSWKEWQQIRSDRYKESKLPSPNGRLPDNQPVTNGIPDDNQPVLNMENSENPPKEKDTKKSSKKSTKNKDKDSLISDKPTVSVSNINPVTSGIPVDNPVSTSGIRNIREDNIREDNIRKEEEEEKTGAAFKTFEDNYQKLTDSTTSRLGDLIDEYGVEKVNYALDEGIKYNKRSFGYIEAVLKKSESPGGNKKPANDNGKVYSNLKVIE